jgi:hypothetical protein
MFSLNRRRRPAPSPREESLPTAVAFIERIARHSSVARVDRDLLARAASARQSRHGIQVGTA